MRPAPRIPVKANDSQEASCVAAWRRQVALLTSGEPHASHVRSLRETWVRPCPGPRRSPDWRAYCKAEAAKAKQQPSRPPPRPTSTRALSGPTGADRRHPWLAGMRIRKASAPRAASLEVLPAAGRGTRAATARTRCDPSQTSRDNITQRKKARNRLEVPGLPLKRGGRDSNPRPSA